MDPSNMVMQLLLGGMLGMLGQGMRVIVGLKKVHDKALQDRVEFAVVFSGAALLTSLLIGFVAGDLAMISATELCKACTAEECKKLVIPLLAAGYAGTDFIEGFIKKYLPKRD